MAQVAAGADPLTAKPALRFSAKLVGLVVFPNQVVNDDVDRFPTYVLMSPALTRRLHASLAYPSYGLKLEHGSADVATVEREIIKLLPRGSVYTFHVTSVTAGQVERASKPEAIALGVFGAIAALVALLIGGLALSRGMWADSEDLDVLRALGAEPLSLSGRHGSDPSRRWYWGRSSPWESPWLSHRWRRSGRPVRSIRHRASPSTGPCSEQGSPCWSSGLGTLAVALAYRRTARQSLGSRVEPGRTPIQRRERSPLVPGFRRQRSPGCVSHSREDTADLPCRCDQR